MTDKKLTIALAGNANVGKSVIFNHLTGLHQHIGNWPGKTVEKAEGTLHYKGYTIDIVDLPGIYSLSTFSLEELISREYIAVEKPDLVINVVDASILERNLFFSLQLIELEIPMILALNQIDIAKSNGIEIDCEKLEKILGVPVVPTVAIKGIGVSDLLEKVIETVEKNRKTNPSKIRYGEEVEEKIRKIVGRIEKFQYKYPPRYTSIKLLEGDEEIQRDVMEIDPEIISTSQRLAGEIERIHGHSCSTVITSERYEVAGEITREIQKITTPKKTSLRETIHTLTTHRILGYPIMIATVLSIFFIIFTLGDFFSGLLSDFFYGWQLAFKSLFGEGIIARLLWGGIIEGIIAGITVAIPYIAPFYFILYLLEDSGYLSRIAFLMDNLMHKIGLHGKAFIPLMLGYGCNVPACLGCRIMETERERLLAGFITTLVPCAATTVIIVGLVGTFVGFEWALAIYIFNLCIIFILGKIASKVLPGEPTALIMEMNEYRVPHLKTVAKQAWFRLKEFIETAFPLIIAGSFLIKLLDVLKLLDQIAFILSPITVIWLGLPTIAGIILIFGVLRKELTLIMLATLLGTTNFGSVLTPIQMVVFTLVTIFYIPCISTIAVLFKEFGYKNALFITIFEIVFAILLGGIAFRLLPMLGVL